MDRPLRTLQHPVHIAINRFPPPMRYLIYGLAVVAAVVFAWALSRMFGLFGRAGWSNRPLARLGQGP